MNVSSISVIIPVYQSAERLPVHIESLRRLRPIVHEFIWVITDSPDRSHEIAREAANELGGQILEVPRGLYQAWNAGIARASGEFIYISTIGDTITPQGLSALFHCLQKAEADVVFSPPAIFPVTKSNLKRSHHWPVFRFAPIPIFIVSPSVCIIQNRLWNRATVVGKEPLFRDTMSRRPIT